MYVFITLYVFVIVVGLNIDIGIGIFTFASIVDSEEYLQNNGIEIRYRTSGFMSSSRNACSL